MAKVIDSSNVLSPEQRQSFSIAVVEGLDAAHIDYIESAWGPIFQRQKQRALLQYFLLPAPLQNDDSYRDILGKLGIPDLGWNWRLKCKVAPGTKREAYGLINGTHVEGVMMVQSGHDSRTSPGQSLVYVEFLSAAPWNRAAIQQPERFRGMGRLLMGVAVEVSRARGLDGRCGLHSLPSAEGFYRRLGMKEFGIDAAKEGMRYFEFDQAGADAFKR